MLKQALIYLLLSILVVIFARYAHLFIVYLMMLYAFVNVKLAPIFNHSGWGLVVRQVLVLVMVPVLITAVPALSYRLIKGKDMPYLIASTWCVWMVFVLSSLLIRF